MTAAPAAPAPLSARPSSEGSPNDAADRAPCFAGTDNAPPPPHPAATLAAGGAGPSVGTGANVGSAAPLEPSPLEPSMARVASPGFAEATVVGGVAELRHPTTRWEATRRGRVRMTG